MKKNKPGEFFLTLFFLLFFIALIAISMTYSPKARRMPLVVMTPAVLLCAGLVVTQAARRWRERKQPEAPAKGTSSGPEEREERKQMFVMFGWMFFLVGMIWVVGFLVTIPVYTLLFMRSLKESWRLSTIVAVSGFIILYLLFVVGLHMELYPGLLFLLFQQA